MPEIDNEAELAIDPPDNQPGGGKAADNSASLQSEQAAAKIDPPSNDGGN